MSSHSNESVLVLKNAQVVLPDRLLEAGSVAIESGLIASVEADGAHAQGKSLDLSGAGLLPGFIDVHIHGAVGVDVLEATPGGLQEISNYLASQGVTGWLPTFVPASDENYASAIA